MSNRKVAGNYCIDSTLSYHARGFPGIIRFRQRGGHHDETNGLPAVYAAIAGTPAPDATVILRDTNLAACP